MIIIFVSKLMSQEDAIGSAQHDEGFFLDNARPDRVERANGNGILSTIRFDTHEIEGQVSFASPKIQGHDGSKEKEGELAIV